MSVVKVATVTVEFRYLAPDDEGEADERADAISVAIGNALYKDAERLVTLGCYSETFQVVDWDETDEPE